MNMEMSYTKIDLNEWSRGKLFKSYIENMRIVMSLTVEIDVTNLIEFSKRNNLKFYPSMIWIVSKVVNTHDEFKYSWNDSPSISGKRKERQRYFCQVGWSFYYPCPSPADAPASIRPWLALTNPLYSPFPGHFSFLSSCHAHSSSCSKSFGESIRYSIFEKTVKFGKNAPA